MQLARVLLCCAAITAAACDGEPVGPPGPPVVTPPAVTPPIASLTVSAVPTGILLGQSFDLTATVVAEDGSALADQAVKWTVDDPNVAMVNRRNRGNAAIVHVFGYGPLTVTATLADRTAAVSFTVRPEPPLLGVVAIDSVSLIERQNGDWFYNPLLRVRDLTGSGASIVAVQFFVPGMGWSPVCSGHRPIAAGQTLDVFPEGYGDFDLNFGGYEGERATSRQGMAVLFVGTLGGASLGRIEVAAPIVGGELPATPSVRGTPWSC
jgi:hypothetical protein